MSERAERRFWYVLGGITAVALLWRVAYVVWQIGRIKLNGDAFYYHWQANDIADGRWFIDPGQYKFFGRVTPSAGHPPAYLLYLAAFSKLGADTETWHRLASTFLGAGTVFVLGALARRLFQNDWAGWGAAFLAATYANLWINDEMLMSEGMYALTFSAALLLAYRFRERPATTTAVAMGAGLGLAALSRAEAITLFPLLAIPWALLVRDRRFRDRLRLAFAACVAGGLVLAPWVAFNMTRFEHPVVMSNGVGSVLMVANCDYTTPGGPAQGAYAGTYHGVYAGYWSIFCASDLDDKIDRYFPAARAEYLDEQLGLIPGTDLHFFGDESTHEVAWRAIAFEDMSRHQSELPSAVTMRVLRMWDLFRPMQNIWLNAQFEGRGEWQSRWATAEYFVLLPASIAGVVVLRRRRVSILPFLAIAATVTVTAATTFGITRYRAPVDAVLPVLAAGAVHAFVVWLRAFMREPDPAIPSFASHPSQAEPAPSLP